ncbi:terpenoid synthase [Trametes punicea]|nr:terpenoid synthase [Trametes punicea]
MIMTTASTIVVTDSAPQALVGYNSVRTLGASFDVSRERWGYDDPIEETKHILRDFLSRLRYRAPHTPLDYRMRKEVEDEIVSWDADLSPAYIAALTDTSCSIAECAYAHTSYQHQLLVAIYTAYAVYVDDLGSRDLEALGEFVKRFVAHQDLQDPVLARFVRQFQDMYVYYPRLSADNINAKSIEALIGMYIEFTAKDMVVAPGATMYPAFLRLKTGIGAAYALFNFVKGWRDPSDNFYLQLIPEIERYTDAINDILSFYKETLEGETDNYIHLRAAAEKKDPVVVLRELANETLESIRKVQSLTSSDKQITDILRRYIMGYVEFHFRARRYRLEDLQM